MSSQRWRKTSICSKYFLEFIHARKLFFFLIEGLASWFALANKMSVEVVCTDSLECFKVFSFLSSLSVMSQVCPEQGPPLSSGMKRRGAGEVLHLWLDMNTTCKQEVNLCGCNPPIGGECLLL